ncbi:MAG: putative Biotin-(acetyl-CoA-carboxylase) ligase [Nitrospira sp.]|nr:putative Biotin-(acetyl-CoA-carboxylase) ligase [Nitrospira sp.]
MGGPAENRSQASTDRLDIGRLQTSLKTDSFGRTLRYRPSTASTNADALAYLQQLAGHPVPHGMAILAECQTAGHGRRGRTWHSPAEGNIYLSVILLPEQTSKQSGSWLSWIPLFSALAVADCLSKLTDLDLTVKWPNDLLVGEKKVGGILCEQTTAPNRTMAVVIGIGLNVNAGLDSFPEELKACATSLAAECGLVIDRVAILADLLLRLEQRMDRLFLHGPACMIGEYMQRCCTLGKTVRVTLETQGLVQGVAESIGPDGCLCLRVESDAGSSPCHSILEIRSADVVHVRG